MNEDDQYNFSYDPHRWNGMGYHDSKNYLHQDYNKTTNNNIDRYQKDNQANVTQINPTHTVGGGAGGGFGSGGGGRLRSSSTESSSSDLHTKRHRAGSISGRLRAASDLEECGLIDKSQKGVLKNKIITGDVALQQALDKYDQGDFSELEAIINSGGLSKEDTVDLLDGLDLDFLTFGKGGVFQNLDDADFSFDDIGGFRMRGMSEMGLPDHANSATSVTTTSSTGVPQSHEPRVSPKGRHQKNAPSGTTREQRSGSIGWFDSNTFLNERDPFLMKNYANTDFSMNALGNNANLEDRITARHNSFDGLIPSSPVHLYTNDGQEEKNSSTSSSQSGYGSSHINPDHNYNFMTTGDLSSMGLGYTLGTLPIGHMGGSLDPRPAAISALAATEFPKRDYGKGYIGIYSAESRKERIERFVEKRKRRVWTKKVKYDVRKNFADSRLRVKGRFVKKEDEELLRDLLTF